VNTRLVGRILGAQGDDVLAAGSGEEACRLALERRPAVVLLDLHLPDTSGEEVMKRLAARPETRDVPVVVVTGGADEARLAALRALGVRGVLQKPYAPSDLVAAVDAALAPS
jgi:CheY-like chemotaxis protein